MGREREDAPWKAGPVKVRKVRGPRSDGLVYWRAECDGAAVGSSWWGRRLDPVESMRLITIATAGRQVVAPGPAGLPGDLVRHLLGAWKAEQHGRHEAGEIKGRSVELYDQAVAYLSAGLGAVRIDDLTGDRVRDYTRERAAGRVVLSGRVLGKGKGARKDWRASSQTVFTELTRLDACWTWGRRRGYAAHDLEIPRVKVAPSRDKYTPTAGEIGAVMAVLAPWARRMVVLLHSTGARRSEIAALTWGQVDLDRGTVWLDGKSGGRTIPLAAPALADLRASRPGEPAERVLPVTLATAQTLSEYLERACRAAGVPRWTPHGFRRLALDSLYESGADVGAVAKFLGQSPTVALTHYRTARPAVLRRAVEAAGLGVVPAGEVLPFPSQIVVTANESGG